MTTCSPDLLRTHAEARRLLAAALCQPEPDLLAAEDVAGRLLTAMATIVPAADLPALPLAATDELLVAYTRLFLGPGPVPAPPYGSVYLDGDGLVAGPSTLAVERFYADHGLGVDQELAELPDHVAIELEFSAHLLDRAATCDDADERDSLLARHAEFDATYLRSWLPALSERMATATVHPFYDGLGSLLRLLPPVPPVPPARGEAER